MPDPAPTPSPRNLWQRRVLDPVVAQLMQGITPEKIALTLAVGSTMAMFPILGTTTGLCLVIGIFLKLNQPIIQVVNYACTPVHLVFIPLAFKWGERLFGVAHSRMEFRAMRQLLVEHPLQFLHDFWLAALHACVVWAVFAPFWLAAVYYSSLPLLREATRVRAEAAAAKAARDAAGTPGP